MTRTVCCNGFVLFFQALQNGYLSPGGPKPRPKKPARAAGVSRDSKEPVLPGIGPTRRQWLLMRYKECVKHDHLVSVGLCQDLRSQLLEKKSLPQKGWGWAQVAKSWFKL